MTQRPDELHVKGTQKRQFLRKLLSVKSVLDSDAVNAAKEKDERAERLDEYNHLVEELRHNSGDGFVSSAGIRQLAIKRMAEKKIQSERRISVEAAIPKEGATLDRYHSESSVLGGLKSSGEAIRGAFMSRSQPQRHSHTMAQAPPIMLGGRRSSGIFVPPSYRAKLLDISDPSDSEESSSHGGRGGSIDGSPNDNVRQKDDIDDDDHPNDEHVDANDADAALWTATTMTPAQLRARRASANTITRNGGEGDRRDSLQQVSSQCAPTLSCASSLSRRSSSSRKSVLQREDSESSISADEHALGGNKDEAATPSKKHIEAAIDLSKRGSEGSSRDSDSRRRSRRASVESSCRRSSLHRRVSLVSVAEDRSIDDDEGSIDLNFDPETLEDDVSLGAANDGECSEMGTSTSTLICRWRRKSEITVDEISSALDDLNASLGDSGHFDVQYLECGGSGENGGSGSCSSDDDWMDKSTSSLICTWRPKPGASQSDLRAEDAERAVEALNFLQGGRNFIKFNLSNGALSSAESELDESSKDGDNDNSPSEVPNVVDWGSPKDQGETTGTSDDNHSQSSLICKFGMRPRQSRRVSEVTIDGDLHEDVPAPHGT